MKEILLNKLKENKLYDRPERGTSMTSNAGITSDGDSSAITSNTQTEHKNYKYINLQFTVNDRHIKKYIIT